MKWFQGMYLLANAKNSIAILGNVKSAIVGTLKAVARRHVFRYLAEFQYRFNCRLRLPELLPRLACVATRSAPRTYKTLKIAYEFGVIRQACA